MYAIFDIGKTNKKLFVFDLQLQQVHKEIYQPELTSDDDGEPCEDLPALVEWIKSRLEYLVHLFPIRYVNFAAYGASLVYVDEDGQLMAPLYDYLKKCPEGLAEKFREQHDPEGNFELETRTKISGYINSGLQIFSIAERKPELFENTARILHLPEYLAGVLTGQFYTSLPSLGCHTGLWNYDIQDYHKWVQSFRHKLPPLSTHEKVISIKFAGKHLHFGMGLHDSSASLVPYLLAGVEYFLLLSTGTWCVAMNAFDSSILRREDLQNDVQFYFSPFGQPVRASSVMLGAQLEDGVAMNEILDQQSDSIIAAIGKSDIRTLYITGGFAQNEEFTDGLIERFPNLDIVRSDMKDATALGAALMVVRPPEYELTLKKLISES